MILVIAGSMQHAETRLREYDKAVSRKDVKFVTPGVGTISLRGMHVQDFDQILWGFGTHHLDQGTWQDLRVMGVVE